MTDIKTIMLLEDVLDALYMYGTSSRYFVNENRVLSITQAQDDAGDRARELAKRIELHLQEECSNEA